MGEVIRLNLHISSNTGFSEVWSSVRDAVQKHQVLIRSTHVSTANLRLEMALLELALCQRDQVCLGFFLPIV